MFEMLFGYPPFSSDTIKETYHKIMNWKHSLVFPYGVPVSREAKDLILHLICDSKDRFDADAIKAHSFFKGVDWETIAQQKSPFIPKLSSPIDTTYFPEANVGFSYPNQEDNKDLYHIPSSISTTDLNFVGFTFKRFLSLSS